MWRAIRYMCYICAGMHMAYDCFAVCILRGGQGNLSDCQDAGMRLIKKEERRKEQGMAVNNVNALSPFGTVQGSQASAKTEQVAQERFDKLMNKVSDQLTGLQKAQAGSSAAATAPKQAFVENAQETAQPKDVSGQESAELKKPEETDMSADNANDAVEQDGSDGTTTGTKDVQTQDGETQEIVEEAAKELEIGRAHV